MGGLGWKFRGTNRAFFERRSPTSLAFCRGGFRRGFMIQMTKKMAKPAQAFCRGGFRRGFMIQMTKKWQNPPKHFVGAGLEENI